MPKGNERTKTLKFNLDKPDEREMWESLQGLRHGYFSERTKRFWKEFFKREDKPK